MPITRYKARRADVRARTSPWCLWGVLQPALASSWPSRATPARCVRAVDGWLTDPQRLRVLCGQVSTRGRLQGIRGRHHCRLDAESAVERELVLRLASLLWRLRRATTMETGLFDIQAGQLLEFGQDRQAEPESRKSLYALFRRTDSADCDRARLDNLRSRSRATSSSAPNSADPSADLASCFLGLANLPSYALDRLSRYEAILWRQARQIVFALDALGRRRPQDRGRHFHFRSRHQRSIDEHEER